MREIFGWRRHLRNVTRSCRIAYYTLSNPHDAALLLETQLLRLQRIPTYVPRQNELPYIAPLVIRTDPTLASRPRLNVLIPGMALRKMSGGPNTAINLVVRVASYGVPLRFISTDIPMDADHGPLRDHFSALTGLPNDTGDVEIVCGFDRSVPLQLGENDIFFASAWWNVQMIKYALPLMRHKRFFYIIQDFEPSFYPWSTQHALALETYSLDYFGILCGNILANFMLESHIGAFADPAFLSDRLTVFEPAVDRTVFFPADRSSEGPRRLLFYARPTIAQRNLFELGLYALRSAVEQGVFDREQWEFLFIGEPIPDVDLGRGIAIRAAPWMSYAGYGNLLRNSDILLSLMLSPHTSYPPIEMAACGRIAITNVYANKTEGTLTEISSNIVPVRPTFEGVLGGLDEAVRRVRADVRDLGGVCVPSEWSESFAQTVPWIVQRFKETIA